VSVGSRILEQRFRVSRLDWFKKKKKKKKRKKKKKIEFCWVKRS
jgi:hypothetical protein